MLEFLIQVGVDGTPGPHLPKLGVGERVDVEGPHGEFVLPRGRLTGDVLFVAGGTGIAPLRSMLWHLLATPTGVRVGLVQSGRTPQDLPYSEEFRRLASQGRIHLVETVTRDAPDWWQGVRGRIDRAQLEAAMTGVEPLCYVCGPDSLGRWAGLSSVPPVRRSRRSPQSCGSCRHGAEPTAVEAVSAGENTGTDQGTDRWCNKVMVNIGVVADRRRGDVGLKLARQVEADHLSVDHGGLGCLGNHLTVWRWHAEHPSDWAVVLEEDAQPVDDFREQLDAALQTAPADVVSLYWGSGYVDDPRNRVKVIDAQRQDVCWVLSCGRILHAVALAVRGDLVLLMTQELGRSSKKPPDRLLSRWARARRHDVAYSIPSLVDHADIPSLIHHHRRAKPLCKRHPDQHVLLRSGRPDAEEPHPAGELLFSRRPGGECWRFRRALQPSSLSREPGQYHASRRLLRTRAENPA